MNWSFMKIWVTIFAIFCSDLALAQESLPSILKNVKVVLGKTNDDFNESLQLIEKNKKMFSRFDVQESEAEKLSLSLDGTSITSNAYDHNTRTLSVGYQQCSTKPMYSIAIFLHEFAHSIFRPNFAAAMAEELFIGKNYQRDHDIAVLTSISPIWQAMPVDVVSMMLPFNELFADTYAVLISDDPKIMSAFFHQCLDEVNLRDFVTPYDIETWDVGPLTGFFDRRHEALNPARYYIWKKYDSELKSSPNGKARLLHAIFLSSVEIVRDLFAKKTTYEQWSKINQSLLNKKFISTIEKHLQN